MTQILIGNTIGCGGKFIRLFFELNTSLRVFKNVFPKKEANVVHFYNIESIFKENINHEDFILLFPVRDFFDHYLYLKNKYNYEFGSHTFIEYLLQTKSNLDFLETNKKIKIVPITIFKSPQNLIKDFTSLSFHIFKQTITDKQALFVSKIVNALNKKHLKLTDQLKYDLINSTMYEEAFEWYMDLYDEAKLGV